MVGIRALAIFYAGFVLAVNSSGNPNPQVRAEQSREPEVTGTWQGRVETLIEDNFQAGTSRRRLFLHTSRETLELEVSPDEVLRSGQLVNVTGRASGKRLIVSQVTSSPADSGASTCSAVGEQKVAVILASFPSKALLSSVTPALMSASFFATGLTVGNFLRESSFGQTWATGDVLGPFVLDADYFDQPLAARDAALRAAAPSTNLTQYNRIFVVAPQGEMGMDSGGMALLGCGPISSPQGVLNASSMWLGAESMVAQGDIVATASHEFGHGFGLEHARFADYGSEPLGPAGQTAAPWDQLHEYGDSFSSMGRNSGQWAAPQKTLLGWLQAGTNTQTVTTSGTFNLSPYEQSGSGQVLRVNRGTNGDDWLWLEFRQPLGTFDATLPAAAFAGALVHYQDPALTATLSGVDPATYTNLINFNPSTFANDPTLHAGETWNDPYGSLSLTLGSPTPAGLSVSVSYAPAPVCPGSVGTSQSFIAAGGAGQIPVTAPGGCSWSAAASVSWITLGSTTSGTGNGTLSFTVAQNANISPRWGKIAVGAGFVIVTQAGSSGWMAISPQTASVPAAGGTGEIAVSTSAPDFAWTFMSNVPWITDVECSCYQSTGPATLRYIVAVNMGPERSGAITIGSLAFTLTQEGGGADPEGLAVNLLAPGNAPSARMNMAMAPFGHSGQAILYGGNWNTTLFADTWLWNGSTWTQLQPADNPGMLAEHAMVYDQARGQIVLFGGIGGVTPTYSNQTWIWDGTNWTQMQPKVSPPAREGHAMAYDAVAQKVVLFGGYGDFAETNDTWTWDGSNWTQVVNPASPVARSGHSMAFDATRGETVLFGGFSSQPTLTWFSDTWVWNGSAWQQMVTATPPAARAGHVLVYNPALEGVLMIGGAGGKDVTGNSWNYDFHRETWMWNGAAWVQQFPVTQPGPAYTIGAAYDDTKQGLTVQLGDDLTCLSRGPKTFLLTGAAPTPPSFTLTPSATRATVVAGASTAIVMSTAALNGFQSQVALSASGLSAGVTANFAPASIAAPGNGASTLTLASASTTAAGSYNLTVTAIGGGVTKTQPVSLTVLPPLSFTLTPSASSASVAAGGSTTIKFSTAALNGFQSAVALTVSGLPAGVTASFVPASIAAPGSGTSTLTLAAASAAAAGSYNLTVTAIGGGVTKTQPVSLTVLPPPSFTLTPSATSATVVVGASTAIKLSTVAVNGFQSQVALSASGLPAGVTANFAPASIAAAGSGTSTLTLAAASGTAAGSYNLMVTAIGGGVTKTQPVSLTALPPPSFTLTPSATSTTVAQGGSTSIKLSTAVLNGFQSAVALSVSGLPKGVTSSFAPASIATPGSGTSTLTVAAASGTALGSYNLTVTAIGGSVTKTQPVSLTVSPPPSFTLTPSATSATAARGGSTAIKLSTTGLNGFQSAVALSVSGLPKGVTASFAPASIAAPGSGTSTLTLSAASGTAVGSYNLTVTATGGGVTKTQPLTLKVK